MKKKILLVIFMLLLTVFLNSERLTFYTQHQKENQQELQHEVTVSLKLVQVYVTDKKGNPVVNLEKSDFILYEDGKIQEITEFEKHILIKPEIEAEEEIKIPPPEEFPFKLNRKFIFLIDVERNGLRGIIKSKETALHFLNTHILPTDEVALFSFSLETGLVLHEYLTTDHGKLRNIIEELRLVPGIDPGGRSSKPMADGFDLSDFDMSKNKLDIPYQVAREKVKTPRELMDEVSKRTAANKFIYEMENLAKSFRYIPGNKNIIFFSTGFTRDQFITDHTFRSNLQKMTKEFTASNSPLFTVNTESMLAPLKGEKTRGDQSLEFLADYTGGRYFENIDNYERINEEIQETTSNYYVLGYYVDLNWDGNYHKIKVEVKRKGCDVYAQEGYFNPKPFSEFSDIEKQFHLIDLALSDEPQFQIPVRLPQTALPFSLEEANAIMLSKISLVKIQDLMDQESELITLVFDRYNNVIDFRRREINFAAVPQDDIYHYALLKLDPGEYKCSLIIRNLLTGDGAVASSTVIIPESQRTGFRISQPLLLISDGEPYYLKSLSREEKGGSSTSFSIEDYISDLYPEISPLVREIGQGTLSIFALIRCSVGKIEEPDVVFYTDIIQLSTKLKLPLSVSVISGKTEDENTDLLLLELTLPELEPGEYSLIITAEEVSINEKFEVRTDIIIK